MVGGLLTVQTETLLQAREPSCPHCRAVCLEPETETVHETETVLKSFSSSACRSLGEEDFPLRPIPGPGGGVGFNMMGAAAADRTHLDREAYNVEDYYREKGWAQAVAKNNYFINLTLAVISANAVYIGIDTDNNKENFILEYAWPYIACENFFATFFTFEIFTRFIAFERKRNCVKDNWFKFDSCLVLLMVVETWLLPLIVVLSGLSVGGLPTGPVRLLRLLRLSRLVRLAKAVPELVTMIKGMFIASRAVASSLAMVLLLIYVFAILLHMAISGEPATSHYFKSLPDAMWTLLMDGTLLDGTGLVLGILKDLNQPNAYVAIIIFIVFILLSAMTVMNMLIGVLCEVVSAVSAGEKDEAAIRDLKETVLVVLKKFDVDGNGMISREELHSVLGDGSALCVLRGLQVNVNYLWALSDMLFEMPDAEVPIKAIMDLFLTSRGDLGVTFKHLSDVMRLVLWNFRSSVGELNDRIDKNLPRYTRPFVRGTEPEPLFVRGTEPGVGAFQL
eukprot:NODE_262_length_1729_cov_360.223417.p1 GENE.NODE_262_length_1729_cov_360.223417~~NODE_262_length_1729_cov_360.223417.p1  ORF type:complete len:554 (+),score=176.07 NODE_262_length_1729_cov_360.223417:146-1663(+)